jgi:hypothetical protein
VPCLYFTDDYSLPSHHWCFCWYHQRSTVFHLVGYCGQASQIAA